MKKGDLGVYTNYISIGGGGEFTAKREVGLYVRDYGPAMIVVLSDGIEKMWVKFQCESLINAA